MTAGPSDRHAEVRNEQVLVRQLSSAQQTMMALGGAIGTGLFLASGLAVNVAGPAVILSYVIVAAVSLLLGRALTDMAVAHPTAGAFGVWASIYVSPFAGYAVRVTYWLAQVIATGAQLVAASIYMAYWFPSVPGAAWVLAFTIALIYLNSRAIGQLGTIEYWLVVIKVAAVVLFVGLAVLMIAGLTGEPAIGLQHITAHDGFAPFGAAGVWLGCCFVIYSFIGVEIVAVTSGEAEDPARTIPRAMRRMVLGLSAIYIVTITLLMALMPWNELGTGESPFVGVLRRLGIPGAAGLMNFVVLSAALSSSNANLYLIARTLFSLSRAGFVSPKLGAVTTEGSPVNALLVSGIGLGAAVIVRGLWPDTAYVWLFGVALFGALFVWLMIFVTHIVFRAPAVPVGSYVGAALIAAILVSTWWVPGLQSTLLVGGPWMLLLAAGYALRKRSTKAVVGSTAACLMMMPAPPAHAQDLAASGFAAVNGTRLYYERSGAGPAVVLLNGGNLDRRMWDDQVPVLARSFTVIRYDIRPYGKSDAPAEGFSSVEDVRALMDYLGVRTASLVGLSLGGRIAVDFVLTYPARVERLVLMGPGLTGFEFDASDPVMAKLVAAIRAGDTRGGMDLWLQHPMMAPAMARPDLARRIRPIAMDNVTAFSRFVKEHFPDPPAITRLHEIRKPTLIIVGERDVPDIQKIAKLLGDQVPGARTVVIPGAGHLPNMEDADGVNKLLLTFLGAA